MEIVRCFGKGNCQLLHIYIHIRIGNLIFCLCMHAATIRGWLLFLSQSSMCSYYSRAATNWGAAFIRINITCKYGILFGLVANYIFPLE